jgi:beta-xylosidase
MFIKHKEDVRQWPRPLTKLFRMQNEVHFWLAQSQQAITYVQEDQWWTSVVGLSEEDDQLQGVWGAEEVALSNLISVVEVQQVHQLAATYNMEPEI